jgi:hypothetical protein
VVTDPPYRGTIPAADRMLVDGRPSARFSARRSGSERGQTVAAEWFSEFFHILLDDRPGRSYMEFDNN